MPRIVWSFSRSLLSFSRPGLFVLLACSMVIACPWRVHAQGTCASTESLPCGEVRARAIDIPGETDCFTFHAETNEAVSILTKAVAGSSIQACWQLVDANGDPIGGTVCGQGQRTVPAPGTYTMKVFDGGNDQIGGYHASFTVLSGSASSCPVATLSCGTAETGVLQVPTDSHTYHFEAAEAGEVVSITTADTSAVIQACWRLFAPDGSAVGTAVCGQADRTLANPGTYTVQVFEQNDDGTGAYQIAVDVLAPLDATCPEGTLATCATPLSRSITTVGDNDVYRLVSAPPNTALKITTATTAGAMNACWQLYTDTGATSGSTVCGSDERVVPAGTYSLRVFDQGQDGTGTYLVSMEPLAGCPTPTPTTAAPNATATVTTGGGTTTPDGGAATPTANGGGATTTPDGAPTPTATATPAAPATSTPGGGGSPSPTGPVATATSAVPVPSPTGLPLAEATQDEFLCYSTVTTRGTPRFVALRGIVLPDAFDQGHFDIRSPNELCSPADRSGGAILDPVTHLERYQLTRWRGEAPYRRVTRHVTTGVGSLSLDATRPVALLVPSAENAIVPPAAPSATDVGAYKCYKVKVTPKTQKFPADAHARITDGLSSPGRQFSLKRPRHLCIPTGLNGPAATNAPLVCYTVRLAKGEPRHVRKGGLFVANELEAGRVNTRREAELCLPAVLEP